LFLAIIKSKGGWEMAQSKIFGTLLDNKACYAAMQAHDARFDGRFFCGVSSTGIYCRPVCRVKVPKEENCTFYTSAAAAEAAGYRPCLKCRPELAPGTAPVDSVSRLARSAAMIIEENCLTTRKVSELAAVLGITDRHLRRVFFAEYGVTPVQYFQTNRLLLAKKLLTDTKITVTDVAMTAGFGSIRRFNDLFKKQYRLTPNSLRSKGQGTTGNHDEITLTIGYRPPYDWNSIIHFLASRAIPGVESVVEGVYRRTVVIRKGEIKYYGWLIVANQTKNHALSVTLAVTLLPVLSQVLARIRHIFDVDCSPDQVHEKLIVMNDVIPDVCIPGIRVPGCFDPFEMSARAILGQQVTVKAAGTLATRLVDAFGEKIDTPYKELTFTFPQPDDICRLDGSIENHLGPLGIIGARARSILALARALVNQSLTLSQRANPANEMEKLQDLPGIGPWTVQYIAMRALGWPDAFPHTDYGVKKALSSRPPKEILILSKAWSPWRSYATILLWNSLDNMPENQKEKCE
jgi:AraC family transcriptional regulator of adaptative response / DNA-3-methyladenine glycosylase II